MADKILKWNNKLLTFDGKYIRTGSSGGGSVIPSDYIGHWKFEDNVLDESANNYDLTWNGGSETYVTGKVAKAAQFNGSNYAGISSIGSSNTWTGLTVAFWFKTTTWDKDFTWYGTCWHFGTTSGGGGGLYCPMNDGGWQVVSGNANSANDGNWHHAVLTWASSDTNARLWFDGNPIGSDTTLSALTAGSNFGIGGTGSGGSHIGDIDEFYIYDRRLSSTEIGYLYNV